MTDTPDRAVVEAAARAIFEPSSDRFMRVEQCVPAAIAALTATTAAHEEGDRAKSDAWSEFEEDYLAGGDDGQLSGSIVHLCRSAFDAAWHMGRSAAFGAALASISTKTAAGAAPYREMAHLRDALETILQRTAAVDVTQHNAALAGLSDIEFIARAALNCAVQS